MDLLRLIALSLSVHQLEPRRVFSFLAFANKKGNKVIEPARNIATMMMMMMMMIGFFGRRQRNTKKPSEKSEAK
jgi:branched-subunit amino acid transport protein AzlD